MGQAHDSQYDEAVHDDVTRWLDALRHGSLQEQAEARSHLSFIFEQRGMVSEAIQAIETNLSLGLGDSSNYARLLVLYRQQHGPSGDDNSLLTGAPSTSDDERDPGLLHFPVQAEFPLRGESLSALSEPISRITPSPEESGQSLSSDEPTATPVPIDSLSRAQRSSVGPSGPTRAIVVGLLGGVIGTTFVTGLYVGDWRFHLITLLTVTALAIVWIQGRLFAQPNANRMPAFASLTVLLLVIAAIWLDSNVGSPGDLARPVATPESMTSQTVTPRQEAHRFAPTVAVLSTPAAGSPLVSTTKLEGLVVSPTRQTANPRIESAIPSSQAQRRPELVVTDVSGGVWLRATPGDGIQIALLANGAQLVDLGDSQDVRGQRWRHVREPRIGDGWIAEAYVRNAASARKIDLARQLQRSDAPISVEALVYLTAMQPRLQAMDQALEAVALLTTRAVERPTLLVDARWNADFSARVASLQDRARELQGGAPIPSDLGEYARTIALMGREVVVASDDLLIGIQAYDPVKIAAAADRLDGVDQRLNQAASQLQAALSGS